MPRLIKFFLIIMTGAPVSAFGMAKGSAISSRFTNQNLHTLKSLRNPGEKQWSNSKMTMSMANVMSLPRGGSIAEAAKNFNSSPSTLFNSSLVALAVLAAAIKILQRTAAGNKSDAVNTKPSSVKELQIRFLSVFWLIRCADWLQGPYFYMVYASKVFNGVPASLALVSKLFLTGFASTAVFGPAVGKALDSYGRKKGTLAFAVIYALGAVSTKSPLLQVLFLGRVMSGIGTSLLFSAPESWLIGEAQRSGDDPDGSWLGETFGLVCTLDTPDLFVSYIPLKTQNYLFYLGLCGRCTCCHCGRAIGRCCRGCTGSNWSI
jgi:hypothetical protein